MTGTDWPTIRMTVGAVCWSCVKCALKLRKAIAAILSQIKRTQRALTSVRIRRKQQHRNRFGSSQRWFLWSFLTTSAISSEPFREVANSLVGRIESRTDWRGRFESGSSMSPMVGEKKKKKKRSELSSKLQTSPKPSVTDPEQKNKTKKKRRRVEAWVFSEVETETMTARKHSASSKRAHICFLQMWNAMRSPNSPPPTQPTQPYTPKAAYYTIQWKYPTHDVTGRTTIFIDICCEILVREYFKKIKIKNIFTVRITAGILNMTNILHAVCNQLDYSRFRAQWKVISDIMNAHTAVHCRLRVYCHWCGHLLSWLLVSLLSLLNVMFLKSV